MQHLVDHVKDSELYPKSCEKPLKGSEQKGQIGSSFSKDHSSCSVDNTGTGVKTRGLVKNLCNHLGREMMTARTRVVAAEMGKIDLQYGQEQNSQDMVTDWLREREERVKYFN